MGMPGLPEMLIILAIVLLLFGSRLPSAMGNLGKSIVEFKKGVKGGEEEAAGKSSDSEPQETTQS